MKVAMLGHSEVGKTTYMCSLYGAMQTPVAGLRLRVAPDDEHRRLLELARSVRNNQYPPGTAVRSEYKFWLRFQTDDPMEFDWADYAGAALSRMADADVDGQARRLREDLANVDGVMLFCDSNALANGRTRGSDLGRLINLVTTAIDSAETPIALAIVLTKVDLAGRIDARILGRFQGLIDAINASEKVYGAVIPIACGAELINVHLPLFFALHGAIRNHGIIKTYERIFAEAQATHARQKSTGIGGWLDKHIWSRVRREPTWEDVALARAKHAYSLGEELQKIQAAFDAINGWVSRLPWIEPQRTVRDYVVRLADLVNTPEGIGTDIRKSRSAGGAMWDFS